MNKENKTTGNISSVIDQLNKTYGKGSVQILGEKTDQEITVISSGSLTLNLALGVGGFPRGRIVEIFGAESSGKSTIAIHAIVEVQKSGGKALYVDYEHAFDVNYAKSLGVNVDSLIFCQPTTAEEGMEIVDKLIASGEIDVAVIDSVAAMVPKSELEGEMGESKMGIHARLMSQALRKITGSISKTNTLCIFINQTREKIGIVYGSNISTPGGNALKFYASQRLDISKSAGDKDKDGAVLNSKVKVKVIKNKVAPPFKVAAFDIVFGKGIDRMGEVVDIAEEFEIIKKTGSWYSFLDSKIGQGRENVKKTLEDNLDILELIEGEIDKIINSPL